MIRVSDKHYCCGCSACAQKCPQQCISMREDSEGFVYPQVDSLKCIECGLCEKVCPYTQHLESSIPVACYTAKNINEEVRLNSSSGGIFDAIAESIIAEVGVVYGARFNGKWEVVHSKAETREQIAPLRKSKYVQSRIGTTFTEIEQLLKTGRRVLFSGTPCQVMALYQFLQKDYGNLIIVDFVCHGVPSPRVWRDYIAQFPMEEVSEILFKDKSTGWRDYSFTIKDAKGKTLFTEPGHRNKYLTAFIHNLILRPSCFNCPAKGGRSHSDITLADFWGIEKVYPELDDNKGVSIIICNTDKGKALIDSIRITKKITGLDKYSAIPNNSCYLQSTIEPKTRAVFWAEYSNNGLDGINDLIGPLRQSRLRKVVNFLKSLAQ